jgi:acetyl-CoA C-acetyltransferase
MGYRKKNRNVGIVGVGETKFSSHREDVNQPEMLHEAVREALDDAGISIDDIDCVVHGNMELLKWYINRTCGTRWGPVLMARTRSG